jgi:glycosyltransferase involved in cell wall biosynthesis
VHLVDALDAVGGVRTYLEGLLPALESRGIESVVFTADETDSCAGVPCVHVAAVGCDRARLDRREREELVHELLDAKADVAYAHVTRSADILDTVSEHMPTIFYAHDYYSVCPGSMRYLQRSERFCTEGVGLRCFWRAHTERSTSRRPDRIFRAYTRVKGWESTWPRLARVFVASQFVGDVLVADGVPAGSLRVLPYFVGSPRAGIEPGREVDVAFIGRLVAPKGAHVLLRALTELDGVSAVIAGDGPDRARLEALARELGLERRVRFEGWISTTDRETLLASARVVAIPSLWDEPFGIVGIEALAAGVPVVASAVGGIPSWLEDGVCGVLVRRGDASGLAAALGDVLFDDQKRATLASGARDVASRFSVERHMELLLPELRAVHVGGFATQSENAVA